MLETPLVGNLKKQEICDAQRMTSYDVEMARRMTSYDVEMARSQLVLGTVLETV